MAVTEKNMNDDKGPKILSVLWVLTALTTVMVVARIYIRLRMLKSFGVDDYLIVASMVMGLAYCGVTTAAVFVGFGKHAAALSLPNLELAIMLNTISFLFGILSFTIPKLAVTAMLNRILNPGRLQKTFLWFLTGTLAVVSGICIIMLFTMCNPPKALWEIHLILEGEAKCMNVWILINYAIFTGGAFLISLRRPSEADLISSIVCFRRSLPRFLSVDGPPETAHVTAKKNCSLRGSRTWFHVSLFRGLLESGRHLLPSACVMAIIKCTQLHGLSDKSDYTCKTLHSFACIKY